MDICTSTHTHTHNIYTKLICWHKYVHQQGKRGCSQNMNWFFRSGNWVCDGVSVLCHQNTFQAEPENKPRFVLLQEHLLRTIIIIVFLSDGAYVWWTLQRYLINEIMNRMNERRNLAYVKWHFMNMVSFFYIFVILPIRTLLFICRSLILTSSLSISLSLLLSLLLPLRHCWPYTFRPFFFAGFASICYSCLIFL